MRPAGSPPEIDSEIRYDSSLRRGLGDQCEASYAHGLAFDEAEMIAYAFAQLDAITQDQDAEEGVQ